MRKLPVLLVVAITGVVLLGLSSVSGQQDDSIPDWIKTTASLWVDGNTTDTYFLAAISWLIDNEVIKHQAYEDLKKEHNALNSRYIQLQTAHDQLQNEPISPTNESQYTAYETWFLEESYLLWLHLPLILKI